ncbi:S8 family serine peptidase [Actinokineospora inagensis]|uniref:S8 family serine peptidase n=1 Tax=Actinokineospora inagensis TaxID=103730 RepID=UPI000410E63B|nr:S8 family serine peptidase [Actinokineospora inagensis]
MLTSRRRTTARAARAAIATVALGTVLSGVHLAPAEAAGAPATAWSHSVTLLTGDRVEVDALGNRSIHPAPNRQKTLFQYYERDGHHFVVPVDALAPLANGKLDERLFDIDTLLADKYDDAHTRTLPLIVTYQPGLAPAHLAGVASTMNLASINASAVAANRDGSAWAAVNTPGVRKIWLDGTRTPLLDKSALQIGAPTAWQAGYTGKGVTVAVLDSGVDTTHPDLTTQVAAEKNFTDSPDGLDWIGHGTHLASIIAGTGAKYKGIANGATLLDGKIFDDDGMSRDSWIIAGMQWAADQGAKIVNLSLGMNDLPDTDPLEDAVNTISAQKGTLFVVAAGNDGLNGGGTVGSPASADAALAVGAVDRADKVTIWSSRGPRIGDGAVKPDITAPGLAIVAARSAQSQGDGQYVAETGTSMAAAHVAGAAAVLAQQHPDWTGEQLKDVLMASAKPGAQQTIFQEGAGRVDVAAAITQAVSASPASVQMGVERLPDTGGQTFTKTVTYRNTGTADTTLDLKVGMLDPNGKASTVLSVSPAHLSVPAGGTATATYTANPAAANVQGLYPGIVTATGPNGTVRTPFVWGRSVQTYEITVPQTGLDGQPAVNSTVTFVSKAAGAKQYPVPPSGRLRLPAGDYSINSVLIGDEVNWLFQPTFTVTGDATVAIDFRQTKRLTITPPTRDATGTFADVALSYGDYATGIAGTDLTRTSTGTVGAPIAGTALTTKIQTQWVADNGDFYGLAYFGHGSLPNGLDKHPSKRDLAHVRADLRTTIAGHNGLRGAFPFPTAGSVLDSSPGYQTYALPHVRDEYYTTEADGAAWTTELIQTAPGSTTAEDTILSPLRRYQAGRGYTETFNQGVFAPAFPLVPKGQSFVGRNKDAIHASMSLFGDASGNAGNGSLSSTVTSLYRNDTKVGDWTNPTPATFNVPADEGTYRLTADAVRTPGTGDASTHVTAAWTFKSSHTDADTALPISTLRVLAPVDANNSAAKDKLFVIPFALQPQATTDYQSPKTLTVEVSYDSGKTWTKVPVFFNTALLHHPNATGTVSLRAVATDKAGQTVELTVLDAYKLR